MKKIVVALLMLWTALATLALIGGSAGAKPAPAVTSGTSFTPYETTGYWQMPDVPDIPANTPEPNGPYSWPQTRLSGLPTAGCVPVAVQVDKYTINSQDDEDYLAGLQSMSGPADDARLSPHGYYAEVLVDASKCETTPPSSPPVSTPPVSTPPVSTPPVSTPPVSTPPASTPPVVTPPASTPAPSTTPATTPATSPPATRTSSSLVIGPPLSTQRPVRHAALASTGSHTGTMVTLALALLLGGAGLVFVGRRRPNGLRRTH